MKHASLSGATSSLSPQVIVQRVNYLKGVRPLDRLGSMKLHSQVSTFPYQAVSFSSVTC
jgi:hypothetical protein